MRAWIACFALAVVLSAAPVSAEVIATCREAKGQTAIVERGGAVSWEQDGLSGTTITILRGADGRYDVGFKGGANDFTARGDGASIFADDELKSALTLVARYPLGTVETFALMSEPNGASTLIWSSLKARVGGVTRGLLLTATCRKG